MNTQKDQSTEAMASLVRVVSRALDITPAALLDAVAHRLRGTDITDAMIRQSLDPVYQSPRSSVDRVGLAKFPNDWIKDRVEAWQEFCKQNDVRATFRDPDDKNYSIVKFKNMALDIVKEEFDVPFYCIIFHVAEDKTMSITYERQDIDNYSPRFRVTSNVPGMTNDVTSAVERFPAIPAPIPVAGTCRRCGCTDANCSDCVRLTGEPCTWVEPDLCSACANLMGR